jgi:hypothetical protein
MMVVDPCSSDNKLLDQHSNDWRISLLLIHNILEAGIPSHDELSEDKNGDKISFVACMADDVKLLLVRCGTYYSAQEASASLSLDQTVKRAMISSDIDPVDV